nr:uncharacterized protein C11orf97 homolog [Columba livia]
MRWARPAVPWGWDCPHPASAVLPLLNPGLWEGEKAPTVTCDGDPGLSVRGHTAAGKKLAYVEPSRRVKEILEEELCFWKEACQVKHPAAVALEGIWSVKKNFSLGSLKPVSRNKNSLLLQPQFYSRHGGMKSKSQY